MSKALEDIAAERQRQIDVEGFTESNDDDYEDGELAMAAASYTTAAVFDNGANNWPPTWPWSPEWWKPSDKRRNLVKAGALILAEIERLDRIEE